jgi:RHH-type transcriptional regulator, proline utilization regulon repressor / proline dehydrogenase / delta 1-pyrroline-5-carboxylate dehydrogenase
MRNVVTRLARGQATTADGPSPRDEIAAYHLMDEARLVGGLSERAIYTAEERRRITALARRLVTNVRADQQTHGGLDAFLNEYGLTSEEGVILMCLAEALLRIPDAETADALIAEKIGGGEWDKHLGQSGSLFVNASTWGLMLTGRIVRVRDDEGASISSLFKRLVRSSGEPVIRQALRQAMRVMGDQFVLGIDIRAALKRATPLTERGYLFSYDMLGEAAQTTADADRYFERYRDALLAVGRFVGPPRNDHSTALMARPGLSVKLSAIHPRYEPGREEQLYAELVPRLVELSSLAREQGVTVTIDAEEQSVLDLSLGIFARVFEDPAVQGWPGLGLAVQAYSRRSIPVLRWLRLLSQRNSRRIPVRLVKGAYWDSEIKWAQQQGLDDYPVFTRKLHTDVSYLACMRLMLSDPDAFYPQFATHNAQTIASALVAGGDAEFEFQRLQGMGEALYADIVESGEFEAPCRIYAPVGGHKDLLAYLVRRLLENGANTSFVNRLADENLPIADIIRDPVETVVHEQEGGTSVAPLVRPPRIFGPNRLNSEGLLLDERPVRESILAGMGETLRTQFDVKPLLGGNPVVADGAPRLIKCPHDRRRSMGQVRDASPEVVDRAVAASAEAFRAWSRKAGPERADILDQVAHLYEQNRAQLMAVIVREAGKTLPNAHDDIREAVDFLRYYANETRRLMSEPVALPGPTGERNWLTLHGRGPFACISPWNFPIAIFTGQIAAALGAGNPVLAKPAEQTSITAHLAASLFHKAGIPGDVLQLLPGGGDVGAALVADERVRGVCFTGSNETAARIHHSLAGRRRGIVPFIAETGGINAMIVDSSALPEQVTIDVVRSAFDSAGQRCSAARVLFVQDDVADPVIEMIAGATQLLKLGDPIDYATDIGPVIDMDAQQRLEAHKGRMQREALSVVFDEPVPHDCRHGTYVSPAIYEIDRMGLLEQEVFGPILHIVRYQQRHLNKVCSAIDEAGYGLTLGIHSRIEAVANYISQNVQVGNIYVNRDQIGAVVGAQPFGGEGLSGTGPKAGGPNYLARFATERVITQDITATGGNVELLGLGDDIIEPIRDLES